MSCPAVPPIHLVLKYAGIQARVARAAATRREAEVAEVTWCAKRSHETLLIAVSQHVHPPSVVGRAANICRPTWQNWLCQADGRLWAEGARQNWAESMWENI